MYSGLIAALAVLFGLWLYLAIVANRERIGLI
jgi:hypothetical protein